MDTKLSGLQYDRLLHLLAMAFTGEALRQLARVYLPDAVPVLSYDKPPLDVADQLLDWAEKRHLVAELICGSVSERPYDTGLRALAAELSVDVPPSPIRPAPKPRPGLAPPPPVPAPRPARSLAIVGGLMLLLTLVAIGVLTTQRTQDETATATRMAERTATTVAAVATSEVEETAEAIVTAIYAAEETETAVAVEAAIREADGSATAVTAEGAIRGAEQTATALAAAAILGTEGTATARAAAAAIREAEGTATALAVAAATHAAEGTASAVAAVTATHAAEGTASAVAAATHAADQASAAVTATHAAEGTMTAIAAATHAADQASAAAAVTREAEGTASVVAAATHAAEGTASAVAAAATHAVEGTASAVAASTDGIKQPPVGVDVPPAVNSDGNMITVVVATSTASVTAGTPAILRPVRSSTPSRTPTVTATAGTTAPPAAAGGVYPAATIIAIHPNNYLPGRSGQPIRAIVNSITLGSAAGTRSAFQQRTTSTIYHYLVAADGHVEQYVADSDTAFSGGVLRNPNTDAVPWLAAIGADKINPDSVTLNIGWEGTHEGGQKGTVSYEGQELFVSLLRGTVTEFWSPTPAQYASGVALTRYLASKYSLPADRAHIIRRSDLDSVTRWYSPGEGFDMTRLISDAQP